MSPFFGFFRPEWRDDVQLYSVRQRTYSPLLGTWLQRDPLGLADLYEPMPNLLAYDSDDPLNTTDPFGLYSCVSVTLRNVTRILPQSRAWCVSFCAGDGVASMTCTRTVRRCYILGIFHVYTSIVEWNTCRCKPPKKKKKKKKKWKGSSKAVGNCPPGCGVFPAEGDTKDECEAAALAACEGANCTRHDCEYSCQCKHAHCFPTS